MKLRARSFFNHRRKTYDPNSVFEVDDVLAFELLQEKHVEPVFDLVPYRAKLKEEPCSLWKAYKLHVEGYPALKASYGENELKLKRFRPRAHNYAKLPSWPRTLKRKKRLPVRVAGSSYVISEYSDPYSPSTHAPNQPLPPFRDYFMNRMPCPSRTSVWAKGPSGNRSNLFINNK